MRTLFAAGRIKRGVRVFDMPIRRPETVARSYTCPIPECAEPDGVTVELHWEPGIGELGILAGWVAGNVATHCGCTLTARETEDVRARAQEEADADG